MTDVKHQRPVTLDESRPETCIIPEGCVDVIFDNFEGRPLAIDAVKTALEGQEVRHRIKRVEIRYASLMEETSILRLFPNVEDVWLNGKRLVQIDTLAELPQLHSLSLDGISPRRSLAILPQLNLLALGVKIRKAGEIEHVRNCRKLRSLGLWEWPWPGWRELDGLRVKWLSIGRGKLESATSASIEVEDVTFNSCRRLKEIDGVTASEMTIIACPNLDLMTLGQVEGLQRLRIRHGGKATTLEFVRGCRSLADLVMTATRVTRDDLSPLIESTSLRAAWLQTPKQVIATVGMANPRITICNGSVCYHEGEQAEEQAYQQRVDEIGAAIYGNGRF